MKFRKRSIFFKKGAQIFSFARGAGDPSYAPAGMYHATDPNM